MSDKAEAIVADLAPMFERAEREGLWFFSIYQKFWMSPAELRSAQREGRFVWGAVNWQLRPPMERLAQLELEAVEAQEAVVAFKERMRAIRSGGP